MAQHFQIAVVGSGPGGYVAALKAGQMGASVAVIEQHPFFGGTCLNWGCIPSKALLASAELLHAIRNGDALGVKGGEVSFDWAKIQARKDGVLKTQRGGIKGLFAARKVTSFQGRAAFNGAGKLAIKKADGAVEEITADKIILAVGSVPSRIPGWPTDPELVCTSDEALHWQTLPKRLLIVGGGVIGCEFACMMHEFGVQVTVVEMMPKFLPGMDGDLADGLQKSFEKRGIKCFTGVKVDDLQTVGGGIKAVLNTGEAIEADKVLVATGRRPATQEIGLDTVGLTVDRGFVRVNEKMETPAAGIYCIGDANGRILLAHAASAMGIVAVENALGHNKVFDAPVPSCIYTFPEVAAVGLTQDAARDKGIPVAVGSFPLNYLGKAQAVGHTEGGVKVLRHRETGELVGVHMMGHNVTEVIAAAGAMLHQKVTVEDVAETVFAHPTISESFKEAAEDALGECLHKPPRQVMRVSVGAGQ